MSVAFKWLLFEGLLPLIGTALLYWALLGCFKMAQTSSFSFKWDEAIDSLGWLYGGAVLAVQAAIKGWGKEPTELISYFCAFIALACFLMLITAMFSKAADNTWQPGRYMKWGATVITGLVLSAGFRIQDLLCCIGGANG